MLLLYLIAAGTAVTSNSAPRYSCRRLHRFVMRLDEVFEISDINSGYIGMIKPQRAQRTQRKRRER